MRTNIAKDISQPETQIWWKKIRFKSSTPILTSISQHFYAIIQLFQFRVILSEIIMPEIFHVKYFLLFLYEIHLLQEINCLKYKKSTPYVPYPSQTNYSIISRSSSESI